MYFPFFRLRLKNFLSATSTEFNTLHILILIPLAAGTYLSAWDPKMQSCAAISKLYILPCTVELGAT
jgi:hypothetical protein